jgi:hypothetical protein
MERKVTPMTSDTTTERAVAIIARAKQLDSTAWAFDAEPDAYVERRLASLWQAKKEIDNAAG